jgi:hypothetical protein
MEQKLEAICKMWRRNKVLAVLLLVNGSGKDEKLKSNVLSDLEMKKRIEGRKEERKEGNKERKKDDDKM